MQVLTLRGRTLVLTALALLAFPSRALDFGDAEVLSRLGEKLDARIPLRPGPGEWFHVTCIALTSSSGAGAPSLAEATVSVERRSRSSHLRIRSASPVQEPAVAFGLTSTCAGGAVSRDFALLIDPPRAGRADPDRPAQRPMQRRAAAGPSPEDAPRATVRPAPEAAPTARAALAAPPPTKATIATPQPTSAPPTPARTRETGFVLRLTSDPIDTSRMRGFDEKSRGRLRERLRLLDSDDQVAAMLALRDDMQRLEARVVELQLKLAAAPAFAPRADARTASGTVEPPKVAASKAEAPKTEAPRAEATKAEPPVTAAPKAEAPKAEPPPAAAPSAAASKPEPPPVAPPKTGAARVDARKAVPAPAPATSAPEDLLPGGPWPWAGALALLLLLLAGWALRRRSRSGAEATEEAPYDAATVWMPPRAGEDDRIEVALPPQSRPAPVHEAGAAPEAPADPAEALRRRYIEERFPEIRNRTIVLDDPASVIKGARLFYEDGAFPRAVELLRFAIEDRPDEIRPWLALFEIYRLERLGGEYAELAARFRQRHGTSDKWEKVRAFGREIDPANPAYRDAPAASLGTIGPREARRMAAAHADPIAENWLEAPMDFENEVLATELRRALMARASVEERDLAPNPMPALRRVEMFSVG